MQAIETAKIELAGKIATNIAALIESNISNQQLNSEEAASITKSVAVAKNLISQKLGQIIIPFEVYRKIDKNIEANIRIAYNNQIAREIAIGTIREQLEKDTELTKQRLDEILSKN